MNSLQLVYKQLFKTYSAPVCVHWYPPAKADSGSIRLLPPPYLILALLLEYNSVTAAVALVASFPKSTRMSTFYANISTFHTTWSTRLWAPLHTTHAQYQFPNYHYPSFMCSPATPIRTLCTALAMRSDIIIMLHAMHNRHINLV